MAISSAGGEHQFILSRDMFRCFLQVADDLFHAVLNIDEVLLVPFKRIIMKK